MKPNTKRKKFVRFSLLGVACALVFFGVTYVFGNNAGAFQTKTWLSNQEDVDFNEIVVVNFSSSMIVGGNFSEDIEILPKTEVDYVWEESNKILKISPKNNWKIGERYEIKINGLKSIFLSSTNETLGFKIISYPKIEEFHPDNGAKDIIIDIEDPGVIKFDKSLKDFNLKVKVSPEKKLNYNLNDDKNVIHFAFEDGYARGEKYEMKFYIKHKKEDKDSFEEVHKTSFRMESPPPEEWGSDFVTRLSNAREFTSAKIKEGKYIDVNLGIQVMTIFENGKIIDSFLISSGKRGMDTPKGNFSISNKHPRPWSKQYGLFMPYWMAIVSSGKYGIHELPEWPSGYKEGESHLGTPVSHGCMRLGVGAAKKVYDWAEIGIPVIIY